MCKEFSDALWAAANLYNQVHVDRPGCCLTDMPNHTVVQGECLSSIAAKAGFTVDALWNLPENAQLKSTRKDPNVLYPGDVVFVPDPRPKLISKSTGPICASAHNMV